MGAKTFTIHIPFNISTVISVNEKNPSAPDKERDREREVNSILKVNIVEYLTF